MACAVGSQRQHSFEQAAPARRFAKKYSGRAIVVRSCGMRQSPRCESIRSRFSRLSLGDGTSMRRHHRSDHLPALPRPQVTRREDIAGDRDTAL